MEDRTMIRAGAPPPPSEVKIRTMRSDLEAMAKSGGGMPSFQNVAVDTVSIEQEYTTPSHAVNLAQPVAVAPAPVLPAEPVAPAPPAIPAEPVAVQPAPVVVAQPIAYATPSEPIQPQEPAPRKDFYPILIVAVVAILAIGGVSYFAYITFFASSSQTPTTTQTPATTLPAVAVATTTPATTTPSSTTPIAPVNSTPAATPTTPPSAELPSSHVSLFQKPADQIITIDFTGTTATTYQKTMLNSLSAADAASSMIEINPKGSGGSNLSIQGLFSAAGASVLSQQALASFNPDATFFVYRDKNGLWPGYVIALATGVTSSSVASLVQQLEQSASIGKIFLMNPGTPSSDGFTDSVTAGTPVRVLPFSGVSFPLYFSYGWYGNDLILSTSNNGFSAAVADLQ